MIKNIKILGIFFGIIMLSMVSFAEDKMPDYNDENEVDLYSNEGNLVFKARLSGISATGKQSGFPPATVANPVGPGSFVKNGYGAEASTAIFFNNYLAAELSLGFNILRTKYSSIANVSNNYGANSNIGKRKDLYMVPLSAIAQWHPAPFGGLSPYLGAGYSGSYLFTKSKAFNIKNSHGAVIQAGLDFYAKDDTLINLEIKQYFLEPKITYKDSVVGTGKNVTSKAKLNPLVVSVGMGFKF